MEPERGRGVVCPGMAGRGGGVCGGGRGGWGAGRRPGGACRRGARTSKAGAPGEERPAGLTLSEAAQALLELRSTPLRAESEATERGPSDHSIGRWQPAPAVLAVVDQTRCDGCGSCVAVCPAEAIAAAAVAQVEPAKCIACGQCVMSCPREAIVLETFSQGAVHQRSP
jgi:ferredoxin